LKST